MSESTLHEGVRELVRAKRLALHDIAIDPELLTQLGFEVDGSEVRLPSLELLDSKAIRGHLSSRATSWLQKIELIPVIGSTNTDLVKRAGNGTVAGIVSIAELQTAGRGRRGRQWLSPFGRNLAVSLGFRTHLPPAELGGFSLCAGLAILDTLHAAGVPSALLKWPNDVLLEGKKLAGVLVEIVAKPSGSEIVVGVGINLDLPDIAVEDIDQPVIDFRRSGIQYSRNTLAASLISNIVDYAESFETRGFGPMRSHFDTHHYFHGRHCRLLQGHDVVAGVVKGVTERGELLLDTESGVKTASAGEVSLRG